LDSQLKKMVIVGRTGIEGGPLRRPIPIIRAAKMSNRQIVGAAIVQKSKMSG